MISPLDEDSVRSAFCSVASYSLTQTVVCISGVARAHVKRAHVKENVWTDASVAGTEVALLYQTALLIRKCFHVWIEVTWRDGYPWHIFYALWIQGEFIRKRDGVGLYVARWGHKIVVLVGVERTTEPPNLGRATRKEFVGGVAENAE